MAAAVLTTLTLLTVFTIVHPHPQCLDFRSPFLPTQPHNFCSQYSDFGCCTTADDRDLRRKFENVRSRVSARVWSQCEGMARELICQNCSPYAAHIYGVEDSMGNNPFPGLCRNYCETLYDTCMDIVPLIDPGLSRRVNLRSKTSFCNGVMNVDVDYCYPELLQNPMLNGNLSNTQITTEGCLCLQEYFSALKNPIFAESPDDGSARMFIGEQVGLVHVSYPGDRELLTTPFLDIRDKVKTSAMEGDERGLFQIAFHPNFLENNKFYLYYSTHLTPRETLTEGEEEESGVPRDHKIRISEFVVSEEDENKADSNSERVILEVYQPYWNHNGGELMFGDDGYLYIFVGDGGRRDDFHNLAQNMSTLLGKVLRINVDRRTGSRPYAIPGDNPFRGERGVRGEIWSSGVRNIWRCGKDTGDKITGTGRGRIICGDVGQDSVEELDLIKKGANYGWNIWEGNECFTTSERCDLSGGRVERPIHTYPHSVGKSVTGGEFYRGCENPNLEGLYIYGDFMSSRLFGLKENRVSRQWENKELYMCGEDVCKNGLTGKYEQYIISFGTDHHGELYMLSTTKAVTTKPSGKVYKIIDPIRRGNPETCESARSNKRLNIVPVVGDSSGGNGAPTINNVNIRACSVASLLCTLLKYRG